MSCAGLVPVMALAEQAGLTGCWTTRFTSQSTRVKSGAANPAPKLATLIAGMCAGADYIDDVDLVRAGGMKTLFDRVYAPSTVGTLLREFTFGHARQLDSVLAEHLAGLCEQVNLLPGARGSRLHRHRFAGAPGLRTRQTGRLLRAHQDRRQTGPAQRAVPAGHHASAPTPRAPVITGIRLRAGKANSGKGAARMVAQATHHRPCGRSQRADHRARRQRLRIPCGDPRVPPLRCGVLPGADPQRRGATRHRRDLRGRLDPGAISRRGARSRYRGLDL